MHRLSFGLVMGIITLLVGATMAIDLLLDTHLHLPLLRVALAALFLAFGARQIVRVLAARRVEVKESP